MLTHKGGFTLPGESGYEKLTLELAERWCADVIRDSDGTQLSEEILNAGYGIYSTICIIRGHNEWANKNLDKLQQCFLMTDPVVANEKSHTIQLMKDHFDQQFSVNDSNEAMKYWQVYDRTEGRLLDENEWSYDGQDQSVTVQTELWHRYTVSFLAYRMWEEISMYNHTTNNWDKEHLMPIEPMYEETQGYLLDWMTNWCESHPATTVVRFTSMFYNFVWVWGSDERNRHRFSDWGSFDFTVSVRALEKFSETYGYAMTAEDFLNGGKYHVSHMPADEKKKDWMAFINDFVIEFGKKLIDLVHDYKKEAYVFYDDSWVGVEPYNARFSEFGFDGMIKCVFSGFESRLCSGVKVKTHELRLHPYLFPVGLGGAPTFAEGGDPTLDAKKYWVNVRRALLRQPVDRIGLGGYLHLVEEYPDFVDYIEQVTEEFHLIKSLHAGGKPYTVPGKVAILHTWGKLRSWTLSGHFHETYMHDLIHVNEALSGMPVEVEFISFDDLKTKNLQQYKTIINAGRAGSAWSGGEVWNDELVVSRLTEWVHHGGIFIGINEPSAASGGDVNFKMAHVLGVDYDLGDRVSHGKWTCGQSNESSKDELIIPEGMDFEDKEHIYIYDKNVDCIKMNPNPAVVINSFGKGKGVYLSSFTYSAESENFLQTLLTMNNDKHLYLSDNCHINCSYYEVDETLLAVNNSGEHQEASIITDKGTINIELEAFELKKIKISR